MTIECSQNVHSIVLGEWESTDRTTSQYWDLQGEEA